MVARDIVLAELTGAHAAHRAHVDRGRGAPGARRQGARGRGSPREVTPAPPAADRRGGPRLRYQHARWRRRCAPSATSRRAWKAWWTARSTAIATDHAPHALTEKEGEFDNAANGIVGLETAVRCCLTGWSGARVLDLATLVARLDRGPGARAGAAGREPRRRGAPADVTILDLERELDGSSPRAFRSKSRNTPFGGWAAPAGRG